MFKKKKQTDLFDDTEGQSQKSKKQKKEKKVKLPRENKPKFNFSNLTNKQKLGFVIVSVSLLLMLVVQPAISIVSSSTKINAVVAVDKISKGSQITYDNITEIEVSKNSVLSNMYLTKNDVVGTYAVYDIAPNEPLTTNKLSKNLPFSDNYMYTLEDGKVAVSITTSSLASSVSSKILPDDIVSIYSILNESEDYTATLFPELTYVKVLDVSDSDGFEASNENVISTITLEVTPAQANLLSGLEYSSSFHLAIVSRGDNEKSQAFIEKQQEYLNVFSEEVASDE